MGFFKKIKDGLLGTEGNGGSGQQGVIWVCFSPQVL